MVTMGGFEPPLTGSRPVASAVRWATGSLVPPGGLEPPPRGLRARHAPLTPRRGAGSAYGYRTRPSALATRNAPPHPGRTRAGGAHRPDRHSRQLSKNPLLRAGGRQGIRTQSPPGGRTGLRPVSGPSARTARLATVPGFEPGPTSFGGSDAPATPRCRFASRPDLLLRQNLPVTWRVLLSRQAQNKKGLLGGRPRRPGSR